jgi:hypothetical protein
MNYKDYQTSYAKYLGVQEARKELILYSVGDDALAPLKKQYINFGDATIHSMIKHLHEKTAIKMMTSQKYDYKTEGYKKPWDPAMSITAYFTGLDKFQISLRTTASQQAWRKKQWWWEHKCGKARCLRRTRWWRGRTDPPPTRRGQTSRPTSRRSGEKGANTWQPWPNSLASSKQHWQCKNRQQRQRKGKYRQ